MQKSEQKPNATHESEHGDLPESGNLSNNQNPAPPRMDARPGDAARSESKPTGRDWSRPSSEGPASTSHPQREEGRKSGNASDPSEEDESKEDSSEPHRDPRAVDPRPKVPAAPHPSAGAP